MKHPSHPKLNHFGLEEEVPPPVTIRTAEARKVIEEHLKSFVKDGLAWQRVGNIENCFW